MMSLLEMYRWRDDLADNLRNWQEPEGLLIATEPDPEEREACRQRLKVAIDVLERVLRG